MSFISTVEKIGEKVVLYKYDGSDLQKDNDNMLEFGQQNQKKICFLDVETTGKDRSGDEIIEIAMKTLLYDLDSHTTSKIIETYESFNEPSIPIKKEDYYVHGIAEETIRGEKIDWEIVNRILSGADLVLAHNASFDRAFIDKGSSISTQKI